MLTIQPILGLCNRMRALDSAISLSKVVELPVRLVWLVDRHLGCRFEDLFERPGEIAEIRTIDRISSIGRVRDRVQRLFGTGIPVDFDQRVMSRLTAEGYDFATLKGTPGFHIASWDRFYPSEKPFAILKPLPSIQEKIDRTVATFDRTLGVHIRRTDHVHARRMSPTVAFVARIEAAIAAGEVDTVFVATDDPAEEDALRRAFPGRILSFPKRSLDRASPEAIQDALVDLHCLASTDRLLASYWSTFSATAVQIGSIPVDIVKVEVP